MRAPRIRCRHSLRLTFLSLTYPTPWQPIAGAFNRALVSALATDHDIEVVAPIPWTQRWKPRRVNSRAGDRPEADSALPHHFPTYFFPPKVLRQYYGDFLWASCRATLRQIGNRFDPHAVIAYWAHPDGELAVRFAKEIGRPSAVIVGGSDVMVLARARRRRAAIVRTLGAADHVLSVGGALRERVLALGIPGERVTVLRRGVDTDLFSPGDRTAARTRLGLPPTVPIAIWVGRMVPIKGVSVLIDAWREMSSLRFGARLYLVGSGPLKAQLRRAVEKQGLADQVLFVDPQPHSALPDWYRSADLTVLPSLSEGTPNVLLESLACGTPFVASDVGSIRGLTSAPERDLVPPGDPETLGATLKRQIADPPMAGLPEAFTWDECRRTFARVLRSITAERSLPK